MLKIMILVKSVDHYGFCGRERHPEAADEGQTGLVLSIENIEEPSFEPSEQERLEGAEEADGPFAYQVLICKLSNGRTVELLGHEIELVTASHDGDLGFSEVL